MCVFGDQGTAIESTSRLPLSSTALHVHGSTLHFAGITLQDDTLSLRRPPPRPRFFFFCRVDPTVFTKRVPSLSR